MRLIIIIIGLTFFSICTKAQIGGRSTYEFLNLTSSPRVAALGGQNVSLISGDASLVYYNPALLNDSLHNHISINVVDYFSDIHFGYASYSRTIDNIGSFSAGIHYINYGEFLRFDETETELGKFYASEYALNLSYARHLSGKWYAGLNFKPIFSSLDYYKSFGLVVDGGLLYHNPEHYIQAGIVVRSFGSQIKSYTGNNIEPIKPEVLAGITTKLKHAPFRFSITARHLEKWDLTYEKPTETGIWLIAFDSIPEPPTKKYEVFGDKLMRHIVVGAELILTKNFYLAFGYNYKRRQEMKIDTRPFMVGTSWGFGIKVSKFNLAYGRASYHLAGATNHFSISTNLSNFY